MNTRRMVGAFGSLAVVVALLAPTAQAADLEPMGPSMLQQTVLRAQFPKSLGGWQQYMYQTTKDAPPTVCWGAKGPITLPKATVAGWVNYQVNQGTNGLVTIFQYATQADAAAALTAMQQADCSGKPKVQTESGAVTGDQGYDQMDAAFTGLGSALTYLEPGQSMRAYVSTISTQRGLAIVQTQVQQFKALPQAMKQQQAGLDRVDRVNSTWHAAVLKAYQSFGVDGQAR